MFHSVITALRQVATDALPVGRYASNHILYDALDRDATPSGQRTVNITHAASPGAQVTLGRPKWRFTGILYVRFYEPSGDGDGQQLADATHMFGKLLGKKLVLDDGSYIHLRMPTLINAPREGQAWVRVLQIPFQADTHAEAAS